MKKVGFTFKPMSFKEIGYILFNRKKCPSCGGKLKRLVVKLGVRNYVTDSSDSNKAPFGSEYRNGDTYDGINSRVSVRSNDLEIKYKCQKCNKSYGLSELLK